MRACSLRSQKCSLCSQESLLRWHQSQSPYQHHQSHHCLQQKCLSPPPHVCVKNVCPPGEVVAMRFMQQQNRKTKLPWNVLETPLQHCFSWNTHDTFCKHPWNFLKCLETALKVPWNILWTSFGYPWSALNHPLMSFRAPLNLPWDTLKTSAKHPWNTLETFLQHQWTDFKHPQKLLKTHWNML